MRYRSVVICKDYYATPYFGIARSVRLSIRTSVCLSHAGSVQFSHRRPPEICGLRTGRRTDIGPPRFLPPSNCHRRGAYRLAAPGATPCYRPHRSSARSIEDLLLQMSRVACVGHVTEPIVSQFGGGADSRWPKVPRFRYGSISPTRRSTFEWKHVPGCCNVPVNESLDRGGQVYSPSRGMTRHDSDAAFVPPHF